MNPFTLETERLVLREWRQTDRAPFAAMNADKRVMEHFPSPLSRKESDAFADRIEEELKRKPFGLWAAEVKDGPSFIGFIGLHEAEWMGAIEIGWRLAYNEWGKGYATEGAKAALAYGLQVLKLKEIVSFTSKNNTRSIRIMEKIGMKRDKKRDFHHPKLPKDHPLSAHVLFYKQLSMNKLQKLYS